MQYICICNFDKYCQVVFHRDDTKLYFHQQNMKVPVPSLPIQREC